MKSRQEILRLSRQKLKKRLLLILICVMVASIAAAIIFVSIMRDEEQPAPQTVLPSIIEGESIENSYPIAYPTVQESQIQNITIINKQSYKDYYDEGEAPATSYVLFRSDVADGNFVLAYNDKDGNQKLYYPDVLDLDPSLDYESLYSKELNDGYGRIYKLTYLCVALELPYFTDRIALAAAGTALDNQLEGFGLADPQSEIVFSYVKTYVISDIVSIVTDNGEITAAGTPIGENNRIRIRYQLLNDSDPDKVYEQVIDLSASHLDAETVEAIRKTSVGKSAVLKETVTRAVKIGSKNVTGFGYYFMVTEEIKGIKTASEITFSDYRPYIYNSMAEYYNYAMLGFYSYVNSVLVAAGLEADSAYEPYLTTDYKQWQNEYIDNPGETVVKDSNVIVYADVFTPVESKLSEAEYGKDNGRFELDSDLQTKHPDVYLSGYETNKDFKMEIDLSKKDGYEKFAAALIGKGIGALNENIVITLHTDSRELTFADGESLTYKYEITEIEAIVTDAADITAIGVAVGSNNAVRIKYNLFINGVKASEVPYHAVLDLSLPQLDADVVASIRAASVGPLAAPIELSAEYTSENSISKNVRYFVDEIIEVYNENGQIVNVITDKCQVYYRYYLTINGKKTDYEIGVVNFAKETGETVDKLKAAMVGKDLSVTEDVKGMALLLFEYTVNYEYMQDFMTYSIKEILAFVKPELISAFAFKNNSERDSFYGESIYENKMTGKYSLYAINSSTCENVVKALGGIGDNSNTSDGLVGFETVAVGITPDLKNFYGLYANTVYFELPRGVIVIDSGDGDTVDDYSQYSKLGFTLFISDEVYEEGVGYYRYVGSDLYDVIAKVSADKLEFLDYGFVELWARKSLMMFDITHLQDIKMEFMMEDLKGSYTFHIPNPSKGDNTFEVRVFEECVVNADKKHTADCGCAQTLYRTFKGDKSFKTLSDFYTQNYTPEGEAYYLGNQLMYDRTYTNTMGVEYFRELMRVLYSTQYDGHLTEAEQNKALESEALMRITIKMDEELAQNTTSDRHVYEFYRLDDRRVMVRLYQIDSDGNMTTEAVSDFYVSLLAFKKIVGNSFALLNAQTLNQDVAYPYLSK